MLMNSTLETPKIGEYATMEALRDAFPDSWVLISQPHLDSQLRAQGGIYLYHHTDRQNVYNKVKTMPDLSFWKVFYTGEYAQEGVEFLL
ncbi:MAG: hypothetical protein EAZ95_05195 [Bacteroidetes bacterium]|nr:MAG: hypothetical protein EAZ95_05195 [Bacteroidota bacterium]